MDPGEFLRFSGFSLILIKCHVNSLSFCFLKVQQEVTQEHELVVDINKILNSFTLEDKSNKNYLLYDPLEEPTRDPEIWQPPPRLQPPAQAAPASRHIANRRLPKEGPKNSGAQGLQRGQSRVGAGSIAEKRSFI